MVVGSHQGVPGSSPGARTKKYKLRKLNFKIVREDTSIFTELKNRVDTSSTTLTRRLGELEDHNLVERIDYETVPPTVVYKLTDSGTSLLPSLETFFEWVLNDTNETE